MNSYIIYTDSACDVSTSLLREWGVCVSSLSFRFDHEDREYTNEEMPISEFYEKMREGFRAKTSAVNVSVFQTEFEKLLQAGFDILYIGFASSLSATYNSAEMAARNLREKYPERKILTVDTLCASAGHAMIVKHAVRKKAEGASIEEAAASAKDLSSRVCHWITVDDLVYLKRGGRISPTTALVGKALGIKPLIYINAEGKLNNLDKARGKKKAMMALADYYGKTAKALHGDVYIAHSEYSDCVDLLTGILQERYNACVALVTDIGPVVGTHIGPGGMIFAYEGKQR